MTEKLRFQAHQFVGTFSSLSGGEYVSEGVMKTFARKEFAVRDDGKIFEIRFEGDGFSYVEANINGPRPTTLDWESP